MFSVLLVNTPANSTQNENISRPEDHHNLDLSNIPRLSTTNPTVVASPAVHTIVEGEDSQHHTQTAQGEDIVAGRSELHVCPCGKPCSRYDE